MQHYSPTHSPSPSPSPVGTVACIIALSPSSGLTPVLVSVITLSYKFTPPLDFQTDVLEAGQPFTIHWATVPRIAQMLQQQEGPQAPAPHYKHDMLKWALLTLNGPI